MAPSWNAGSIPAKHSQFVLDHFEEWKREQRQQVANRGAQADDPDAEEAYNLRMLRQNLNGYTCHKKLDAYAACLETNHLIKREVNGLGAAALHSPSGVHAKVCRPAHTAYVGCMSSQENQEAVLENATLHRFCTPHRYDLFRCLHLNKEVEAETHEPQCIPLYRRLVRCGLNHMWNDYWRALTNFGDGDEYHLYELYRNDSKRQEYTRLLLASEEQQREYLRDRMENKLGYYLSEGDGGVGDEP